MNNRYQTLIKMRDCLREVQQSLPDTTEAGRNRYICVEVHETSQFKNEEYDVVDQVHSYVDRALDGKYCFEAWLYKHNPNRTFSPKKIMTLRKRFIDILCARINKEIKKERRKLPQE